MLDYNQYWIWLAHSQSSTREERVAAESEASIHAEAVRTLGMGAREAVELLIGLAASPLQWTDWHIEALAHGLVEEAVEIYGLDVLLQMRDDTASRISAAVEAYLSSA